MQNHKPRIFIASTVESLNVASAVNLNFDYDAEPTVWRFGFQLSSDSISSLLDRARASDFAIFIFTPDDVTTIREQTKATVRDNVLFELGLFVGALGKERCFIMKPRDVDLYIPTDLLGLEPSDYVARRGDENLVAAVDAPCTRIRNRVAELGLLPQVAEPEKPGRRVVPYDYTVDRTELTILARLAASHISDPEGLSTWQLLDKLRAIPEQFVAIALIKLERLGLVERTIQVSQDSEYYCYALTAAGLDHILENESGLTQVVDPNSRSRGQFAPPAPNSFDDDIPF